MPEISYIEDKKSILNIYDLYKTQCAGKHLPETKYQLVRGQLERCFRQTLKKYKPDNTTKRNLRHLHELNANYGWYCRLCKDNPDFDTDALKSYSNEMLEKLAEIGAQKIQEARHDNPALSNVYIEGLVNWPLGTKNGIYPDLFSLIIEKMTRRVAISLPKSCKSSDISCNGNTEDSYHPVYPSYKVLISTGSDVDLTPGMGTAPCALHQGNRPIENPREDEVSGGPIPISNCVTAFVDESYRPTNPLLQLGMGESGPQACYSYIICNGKLTSESRISVDNTITSCACPARWATNVTEATREALLTVLEVMAYRYHYDGHIYIYTDSKTVAGTWNKDAFIKKFSDLFTSVTVSYVPRKNNKTADSIVRNQFFPAISREEMDLLIANYQRYSQFYRDNAFVGSLFYNPKRDIPQLIDSLERLSLLEGCRVDGPNRPLEIVDAILDNIENRSIMERTAM